MNLWHQVGHALYMAFAMFWDLLWALILGFLISGMVQAVVSKRKIAEVLGDDKPTTIATACGLGAASSSCSYAAVAIDVHCSAKAQSSRRRGIPVRYSLNMTLQTVGAGCRNPSRVVRCTSMFRVATESYMKMKFISDVEHLPTVMAVPTKLAKRGTICAKARGDRFVRR